MLEAWPFVLRLMLSLLAGYLMGSANGAIILTRLLGRGDIRELGNRNPGTANIGRTLGRGWGAAVFFFDGLKAIGPMMLARWLFFPVHGPLETFVLAATGIAAVIGHRTPVWHGFRGGRGVASAIFVYFFFIPVEVVASLLLAAALMMALRRDPEYRLARWVPMTCAILVPAVTLIASRLFSVPLFGYLSIGGHPWYVSAAVLGITLIVLGLNTPVVVGELRGRHIA